ncbi:MAG TPA: cupin domain-containing protein [Rhizomicrobium sp.]|nr:cupin domain-containing protein [Rhizomicrobium sp.]
MRYVRPVDFKVFPEKQFHSHVIANWDNGVESCMVILTRVPPGTATGANGVTLGSHTHDVDQFYCVLSGRMTVELGKTLHRAVPGAIVQIPAGLPHWNWNEGEEDEIHLEILAPSPMTYDFARAYRADRDRPARVTEGAVRSVEFAGRATGSTPLLRSLADQSTGSKDIAIKLIDLPRASPNNAAEDEFLSISGADNFYFVSEGVLGVQIGLERHEVGPYSLVVLPSGVAHRIWNADKKTGTRVYHLRTPLPAPAVRGDASVRFA